MTPRLDHIAVTRQDETPGTRRIVLVAGAGRESWSFELSPGLLAALTRDACGQLAPLLAGQAAPAADMPPVPGLKPPVPEQPPMAVSGWDMDIAARTVWGEARSKPPTDDIAVAHVIVNRARLAAAWVARKGRPHPLFGDGTLAGACLAPWQFSCWNAADPNRAKMMALDDATLSPFKTLVEQALTEPDPTRGATHYHADYVSPAWAAGKEPTVTLGPHLFYNDID